MKDRIIKFMKSENLSASQLADDIGVQRSGISHILSGRNNPSLEFVQRILHRYPNLNPDWILNNKGSMYRSTPQPGLFDTLETAAPMTVPELTSLFPEMETEEITTPETEIIPDKTAPVKEKPMDKSIKAGKEVAKIVILYQDGTFEAFLPNS
ncbi:MAG: transcriptional regulator [Bacteroidetes bacterium HGW-Bacteroidetes-21]|jgi:transcriptional regulator with XRE-family HTH domain|nr:MAG: transcriptional regulator [Bacteroidetes bacterium HGW-Bacteroidetes-21]